MTITYFYPNESEGTVPLIIWKHIGGIAFSQLQFDSYFGLYN